MVNFQESVKNTRKTMGMNLRDFGSSLGVTHTTISNWESGSTVAGKYHLLALAMRYSDWRRDFALDCIQAIDPSYFETAEMQKVVS